MAKLKKNEYNPAKIEGKWQKKWARSKIYSSAEPHPNPLLNKEREDAAKLKSVKVNKGNAVSQEKFYALDMFPYPSGEGLHVGHPKGYIATDVVSRFQRMNGKNVLHPMGFDAFGLPAENYALKTKTNPEIAVKKNVARYKKQLEILGFDYDWSREVNTTDPKYYKWTQWIFLQMFKKGLAYESFEPINWCPSCKTGLANEDVENGRCERCGTPVEKKPLRQWVLKITDYADRLLKDLDAKEKNLEFRILNLDENKKAHIDGGFDIDKIPHVIDKKNPPREGKETKPPRRTIHALVRDPKTGKFLGLKWFKHPWITFIVGGVEQGEDLVDAAKREVKEETGYSDIKFVQFLGGPVKAEYFAAHKDENRIAITSGILFELVSDKKTDIATEEKKEHEPIWMEKREMTEEIMTCAELPFWLERLPTASVEFNNGVPTFTQIVEPGTVRKELPFVERNAIAAVVKHWSEDKYIGLKWKKVAWQTIITGGPEEGQTMEEGAVNEIIEETGYLHPKLIKHIGKVNSKFFHVPKNVNRHAHFDVMSFELADGARNKVSNEEKGNHEVVWLTKEEMSDFLTAEAQKYMWNTFFLGKKFDPANSPGVLSAVGGPTSSKPLLDWPESIKEAQRNWIGRSEGALIKFNLCVGSAEAAPVADVSSLKPNRKPLAGLSGGNVRSVASSTESVPVKSVEVFTTRPDTLFGVTYLVLAPEHKLVNELLNVVKNKKEVGAYINRAKNETEIERTDAKKEKTGVELKGVKVVNPANNEEVPVWVADYVLPDYGTGAVMAVPAHDERDWEFAKKFGLAIRQVIAPFFTATSGPDIPRSDKKDSFRRNVIGIVKHWSENKYIALNWKQTGWHSFVVGGVEQNESDEKSCAREIQEETGYKNLKFIKKIGPEVHAYHYTPHKDQNRYGYCQALYFELIDGEKEDTSIEENTKHEIKWVNGNEMSGYLNLENNLFYWNIFEKGERSFVGEGKLINSDKFNGKNSEEIKKEITSHVSGQWVTKYKLRDWVFSRQRYWGEPIPIIHCDRCGVMAVPEKDLPVKLPRVKYYEPTGTGESPLAAIKKWVNVKCPKCKGLGQRETNTMPQWAGSSWYYLRYEDPKNNKQLVDRKKEKYWSPVDLYVGGAEHATRHLIYARFWHKFLYDIGVVSTIEPFIKLQNVGLIIGEDGKKMSKRFGNVVNPDDIVKTYGADTLRIYEMFMGPFDQQIAWNTSSMVGSRRFIERVWKLASHVIPASASPVADVFSLKPNRKPLAGLSGGNVRSGLASAENVPTVNSSAKSSYGGSGTSRGGLAERAICSPSEGAGSPGEDFAGHDALINRVLHRTIKKVTEDVQNLRFNTAISSLMIATNELEKADTVTKEQFEILLKLLAPFASHVAEELWITLGNKKSIHISEWPKYDPKLITEDEVTIVVQVNGKVRSSFKVDINTNEEEVKNKALNLPEIKKWIGDKAIKKVIVVKGRLVSIVL